MAVMACWSVCARKEYSTKSGRRTNHLRTHDLLVLSCKYPLRTHCASAATCGTHGHPDRTFHCKVCLLYTYCYLLLQNQNFGHHQVKNKQTKDNKIVSGFSQHHNISFYFIWTTCFSHLTTISPSLRNLE